MEYTGSVEKGKKYISILSILYVIATVGLVIVVPILLFETLSGAMIIKFVIRFAIGMMILNSIEDGKSWVRILTAFFYCITIIVSLQNMSGIVEINEINSVASLIVIVCLIIYAISAVMLLFSPSIKALGK